jgi:polar amino acid transport system permease protein
VLANFSHFVSVLGQGAGTTIELTVGGIVVATVDSFVAGILSRSRIRVVRFLVRVYVEGWRGSSELVQLFWVAFAAPALIGFKLVPLWAGIIVIGLNIGAYGAEIVRGALDAVPKAQREGAVALSLSPWQQLRLVLLPQSVVEMIPPFNTLFIQLIQATALASLINVSDITYEGKQILEPAFSGQMPLILSLMLVMYLILSLLLTGLMRVAERFAARWAGRPPRPIRLRLFVRPGHLAVAGPLAAANAGTAAANAGTNAGTNSGASARTGGAS